ncbi:MAG: hypothetical protein KGS72_06585 [Cyanobacteria bacterium REEB67]|nr:hypothetical protein [Cyanobacteria bacterium REEB67]
MADVKINVFTPAGKHVGYFLNPAIKSFPEGDYEVQGAFYDVDGDKVVKLEFNPQVLPYSCDISSLSAAHKQLTSCYVQRGRQPVMMTGRGA